MPSQVQDDSVPICLEGGQGFILPASDTEWQLPDVLRAFLYGFALIYFFLGVSIVSDIFMSAIEVITSRRRQRMLPVTGRLVTIRIWNDTVANLTLMALGSSAPEILLSVTELLGKSMHSGSLGPATIVGSASFNLLMIIALCIFVIPCNETRKVEMVTVFLITVAFMFVAYLWLVFIVAGHTKDVIDIWEALVTLLLLPLLVFFSYLGDIGKFGEMGKTLEVRQEDVNRACELLGNHDRETVQAVRAGLAANPALLLRIEAPSAADMVELRSSVKKFIVTKQSRATHRVGAIRSMTGGKRVSTAGPSSTSFSMVPKVSGLTGECTDPGVPIALAKGAGPILVQFAAETVCMSDDATTKPLIITRSGDCTEQLLLSIEVIGLNRHAKENSKKARLKKAVSFDDSSRPSGSTSTPSVTTSSRESTCSRPSGSTSTPSATISSRESTRSRAKISTVSRSSNFSMSSAMTSRTNRSTFWMRSSMCDISKSVVLFNENQNCMEVVISRPEGVGPEEDDSNQFAVELAEVVLVAYNSSEGENRCQTHDGLEGAKPMTAEIGDISRTLIVLHSAESQGFLSFPYERIHIQAAEQPQTVQIMVQRMEGCSGAVSCTYRTESLSAVPGYDYEEKSGTIEFANNVTEVFIEVEILSKGSATNAQDFLLVLEEPSGGAVFNPDTDGGVESKILTIEIGPRAGAGRGLVKSLDRLLNFDEVRLGTAEYKDQFVAAIFCNGSYEDQQEASAVDWAFHIFALPWKLVFVFIPPTRYCGGWVCFFMALLFIGFLTAFIGDLAELFGCILGATPLLTAISFVALGTSMPDLFASKTAATQDATADASIVNVTGSNSVNVFLGLGLPWTVASFYWQFAEVDPDWVRRYPDIASQYQGSMRFVVRNGDLVFSVIIFSMCALVALTILGVRRRKVGAELGGPMSLKCCSSSSMVVLWVGYISLSGWFSLRSAKAPVSEFIAVYCFHGVLMLAPFIVFLGVARLYTPKRVIASLTVDEDSKDHMDMRKKQSERSEADESLRSRNEIAEVLALAPVRKPAKSSPKSPTDTFLEFEPSEVKVELGQSSLDPRYANTDEDMCSFPTGCCVQGSFPSEDAVEPEAELTTI